MLASSLRSLRLRGKDSWLMHFLKQINHREGMSTTVAHASGSERFVLFPWLCFCLFREIPCSSVANSSASAYSYFRVLLLLCLPSVANASAYSPTVAHGSGSERQLS